MEKFRNIFLNRRTIHHILEVRNYDIKDPKRSFEDFELFEEKFASFIEEDDINGLKAEISDIYRSKTDKKNKIYIWFTPLRTDTKSSGKDVLQEFIRLIETNDCNSGIIIVESKLSPAAKTEFENAKKKFLNIQVFFSDELYSTIINHILVPKHELIPASEKSSLLKEMKLPSPNSLEFILTTDPVVKFYGWHVGDMIRIYRNNDMVDIIAPLTYGYRIVKSL